MLASMGEIVPFGTREDGLNIFLDHKVEEGYTTLQEKRQARKAEK
jgi:hypothetical protein